MREGKRWNRCYYKETKRKRKNKKKSKRRKPKKKSSFLSAIKLAKNMKSNWDLKLCFAVPSLFTETIKEADPLLVGPFYYW